MSCLASCCAAATCGLCSSVASGISKRSARLAYCGLFGGSLIVSWILREVAAPLLKKIPWISTSQTHSTEWYQQEAVLRVSLGNFLFFSIFALIMIGVKDQNDRRDSWHHGGWVAKMVIWVLLIILMFFVPNVVISIYGQFRPHGGNFIWSNYQISIWCNYYLCDSCKQYRCVLDRAKFGCFHNLSYDDWLLPQ